jgi:hypothetical protein
LKLQYDRPLSNFAFNFNLRRYTEVDVLATAGADRKVKLWRAP